MRPLLISPFCGVLLAGCLSSVLHAGDLSDLPVVMGDSINTSNAPAGAVTPRYFEITPTEEVINSVKQAMGNISPEEQAQIEQAVEDYRHASQYEEDVKPLNESVQLKIQQRNPVKLMLVAGFETDILFFDLQGNPWPVGDVGTGNKKRVSAEKSEILPHGVLVNSAEGKLAGRTNLKARFEGLDSPVSFPIEINTKVYHDTLKIILPGIAPTATQGSHFDLREALDDPIARAILDNPVDPEAAKQCESRLAIARSISGQVLIGIQPVSFVCGQSLYIRTRFLHLPAPDPSGLVNGSDGYQVYRFDNPGDVFTFVGHDGRAVFLEIPVPEGQIGARFGKSVRLNK